MSDEATTPVEETSTPTPVNQRMASYGTALKNYFTCFSFSKRASRSEFWFAMTIFLPVMILPLIFKISAVATIAFPFRAPEAGAYIMLIASTIVWWFFMLLYWGALARRINDMGGSGSVAGLAFIVMLVEDLICIFLLLNVVKGPLNGCLDLRDLGLKFDLPEILQSVKMVTPYILMVAGLYGFVCSLIPSKMVENKYGPVPFCD